jgi:hypothetical protein
LLMELKAEIDFRLNGTMLLCQDEAIDDWSKKFLILHLISRLMLFLAILLTMRMVGLLGLAPLSSVFF